MVNLEEWSKYPTPIMLKNLENNQRVESRLSSRKADLIVEIRASKY